MENSPDEETASAYKPDGVILTICQLTSETKTKEAEQKSKYNLNYTSNIEPWKLVKEQHFLCWYLSELFALSV